MFNINNSFNNFVKNTPVESKVFTITNYIPVIGTVLQVAKIESLRQEGTPNSFKAYDNAKEIVILSKKMNTNFFNGDRLLPIVAFFCWGTLPALTVGLVVASIALNAFRLGCVAIADDLKARNPHLIYA